MADAQRYLFTIVNLVGEVARETSSVVKKRADVRYSLDVPLDLYQARGPGLDRIGEGWGLDVSYRGLGLLIDRECQPGTVLLVDLEPLVHQPFLAPVTIVHCRRLTAGIVRLGAQFVFDDVARETYTNLLIQQRGGQVPPPGDTSPGGSQRESEAARWQHGGGAGRGHDAA